MPDKDGPVSLEFVPGGGGWAKVKMKIFDDSFTFPISYIGDSVHALVERIYYLYPDWYHDESDYRVMEYYDDVEAVSTIDGVTAKRKWSNVPWRTQLIWDGEGTFVNVNFERPKTIEVNCDVTITLDVHQDGEAVHTYHVRYMDLAYALAKGVTELLVRYGIVGYYESTWMEDINIRHFLRIKEIALNETIELEADDQKADNDIYKSRLGQEMDLLIRPMP